MHETYLQNEREWEEKWKSHLDWIGAGFRYGKVELTLEGMEIGKKDLQSHNRTSLIKVMKELVYELEAMKHDDGIGWSDEIQAYNQALQLAIDKIENFINKIQ